MKPSELIEKVCKTQGIKRYKLAQQIGIKQQRLSDWANDKAWPDSLAAAILAEAAGLDPWLTICELEEERTTKEDQKTAWGRFLEAARVKAAHLAASAAQGLKTVLVGILAPAICGALLTGALAGEAKASGGERLYEKPVSHNRDICRLLAALRRRCGHLWPLVRVLHRTRTLLTRSAALVTQAPKPAF